ncbi:receptor activity-modifying protein 2 isoform X1 [Accipiter gentilis]|uniref:receptor activity-modifying protein 2 isoform X1 n=1 Tax=Astur gentilis TaxID=8957 RepID=UPI00210F93DB|nr:receptor activity-modifying protein 2 isoform X1 [Accipiter gentilis]XP_049656905.1 receptor activity-modifying protein 2 isoform X1 [Accipiter gentilis]XP_049656906.1 receptor activity-modifying protein 2 isoform X1 [Accipiter gentilis]XP_049656907.1 receptor activity-modifying protein 2 isoform X1 [Accipiter gentilis]XP_049656908.1 receptor activity-modifying protein 2 isoform X1 [Accipiter gentilis]
MGQAPSLAPPGGGWQGAPAMPGWGGWEPQVLAGSQCLIPACPVPARSLWTPQEGGGHRRPRAVLRSLGVSLAEAAAARLEAPVAPTKSGTRGSNPSAPRALRPDGFQTRSLARERSHSALGEVAAAAWGGSGSFARTFAGEREAQRDHLSAVGRLPPSCTSSCSDSCSACPTGGLLKGQLWARALPWARGEMSSTSLSLVLRWECCRPTGLGSSSVALLCRGMQAPQAGAAPGPRGSSRAGQAPGWAVREEAVRAEDWQRQPSLCPLPISRPASASHPWAGCTTALPFPAAGRGQGAALAMPAMGQVAR